MKNRPSSEHPISHGIWSLRSKEMLQAVQCYLDGDISKLTAGWVLEILHDETGAVSLESKSAIQNMLLNYPGFVPSDDGLYNYVFFRQLEFACAATRNAYEKGLRLVD